MKARDTTAPIRREFIVERAASSEGGNPRIKITTEQTDRMGDIVVASGMDASAYLQNPVVLYSHDSQGLPIGKTVDLKTVKGSHVEAEWEWAPTAEAATIRSLYEGGFINAASIGFLPDYSKAEELPAPEGAWFPPLKFHKWQLLEWSLTPVPANPGALRLAISEYDAGRKDLLDAILKSGRVLSAANENTLRDARDLIDKVLASVQTAEPVDDKGIGLHGNSSHIILNGVITTDTESDPIPDSLSPNIAAIVTLGITVQESVDLVLDAAVRSALADALGVGSL